MCVIFQMSLRMSVTHIEPIVTHGGCCLKWPDDSIAADSTCWPHFTMDRNYFGQTYLILVARSPPEGGIAPFRNVS